MKKVPSDAKRMMKIPAGLALVGGNAWLSAKFAPLMIANYITITGLCLLVILAFFIMYFMARIKTNREMFYDMKGKDGKLFNKWVPIKRPKVMAWLYILNALAASFIWYYIGGSTYMVYITILIWIGAINIFFIQDEVFRKQEKSLQSKDIS